MNRHFPFIAALLVACAVISAPAQDSPTGTPESADAAPNGVTTTVSPAVAQFQRIEDAWSEAVNRHDQYALELVLSPLFVDVSAQGDVTTRNQQVVQLLSGPDKSMSLSQKVVTVRLLGDTAVANGTYVLHHKVGSAEMDEKGVFTHVFERARGGWLCINSQRTVLRQDVNNKQHKQSTSDSPFHIPFLMRGDKGPQ
jgi:ketosteroid isomerase-like protein